ncbi:MAG: hypothetical protein GPW16_03020 [Euryarchaeota archaeon]|jgi:sulfur carrier protein ThiS|nr:hypothetical protein [Euryarchaeota archaeon]
MIRVTILNPERKVFEIENVKTIFDIMRVLGLNPDAYIAFIDGKPVPEDKKIEDNINVDLMQVFSGG